MLTLTTWIHRPTAVLPCRLLDNHPTQCSPHSTALTAPPSNCCPHIAVLTLLSSHCSPHHPTVVHNYPTQCYLHLNKPTMQATTPSHTSTQELVPAAHAPDSLNHPAVGELERSGELFRSPGDPDMGADPSKCTVLFPVLEIDLGAVVLPLRASLPVAESLDSFDSGSSSSLDDSSILEATSRRLDIARPCT